MIPVIPLRILIPAVLIATGLCLALVLGIVLRRAFIVWWTRGGKRLAAQSERVIEDALRSDNPGRLFERAFRWSRAAKIDSFARAAERVAQRYPDLYDWIDVKAPLGPLLSGIINAPHRRFLPYQRWRRVAAARAAGTLRSLSSIEALSRALEHPDLEVAYAAADSLAKMNQPATARILLQTISVKARLNNSRLAALVEGMECDIVGELREQFARDDTQALYWAATLVAHKRVYELIEELRPLLESPHGNVRAATCEAVGALAIPLTDRWLTPLLSDDEWYVQSHAARALGTLKATWAIPSVAILLAHHEWWVRQASADALVEIGKPALDAVEEVLWSEDRFARNTAVEVLERTGWIESVLPRVRSDRAGVDALLRQFVANGGLGYAENAVFGARGPALDLLLEILHDVGDDATYGRLRAAAEQLPEEDRERVRAVAAEVRGR